MTRSPSRSIYSKLKGKINQQIQQLPHLTAKIQQEIVHIRQDIKSINMDISLLKGQLNTEVKSTEKSVSEIKFRCTTKSNKSELNCFRGEL